MSLSRRRFLVYVGLGSCAALRGPPAGSRPALTRRRPRGPGFFEPIAPSKEDALGLPDGYDRDLVCSWGDALGSTVPKVSVQVEGLSAGQPESFGCNSDFLAYFPIDALEGGESGKAGLLWVNHEYPDPLFVSGYTPMDFFSGKRKSAEMVLREKLSVGGSVLFVGRGDDGHWKRAHRPGLTRRFTALYPTFAFTGPAAELAGGKERQCAGTLANCSGGRTPWSTALSCEENYPDYNQDRRKPGYCWKDADGIGIREEQFGWVVEADPFGELPPRKHTSLGRFKHENVALRWDGPEKRLVAYMGDDEADQFLYKFVSDEPYVEPQSGRWTKERREAMSGLLARGTLYAARFDEKSPTGEWLPLTARNPKLQGQRFRTKGADGNERELAFVDDATILFFARQAARFLGATPLDRPEDCEVHPRDRSLYVALTNNASRGELFGRIVRLIEKDGNPEGAGFDFEVFLAGGPESGLACPDNLAFDKLGNLWVACDIGTDKLGQGDYERFGNNGLFVVPTSGADAGHAFQFASGPVGCELTGPCFSEDHETLFLSVQHPGEESLSREEPRSRWPNGGADWPRAAVVAITGFRW